MRFLSIGDIHGRSDWKKADFSGYDKVIFVGDYTDSPTIKSAVILENLIEIIRLKKSNPEKYVLVLGNHDVQYMFYPNFRCNGFQPEIREGIEILFTENREIFKLAYQYKNYLWTHAGISSKWYNRYKEHLILHENETLADKLNEIFHSSFNYFLHEVGPKRGGLKGNVGSPLWADITETKAGIIPGYHQIVGHTQQDKIVTFNSFEDKIFTDSSITFIDVLENGPEFYSIDI